MRLALTTSMCALVLALPAVDGVAAARAATAAKKKVAVVTRNFVGPAVQADRWGTVQVTIVVRKTTTTVGKKKTVARRITGVSATYPTHTDRSIVINQRAIPILRSEVLSAQSTGINFVSGATDTSGAFIQSLQSAIVSARRA